MIRSTTRIEHLDAVARAGTLLVVALVCALPLAMALCPPSALNGAGAGTGDVVAAALSSLDRDLNGARLLPEPERRDTPPSMTVASACPIDTDAFAYDANAPPVLGVFDSTPGNARAGVTGLGHHLRR